MPPKKKGQQAKKKQQIRQTEGPVDDLIQNEDLQQPLEQQTSDFKMEIQSDDNNQFTNQFSDIQVEQIQQSIKDFQMNFSVNSEIDEDSIVKIHNNYEQIQYQLENALIKKTTSNFMIYGLKGFGRKTGIKYGIKFLKKKYNIDIDLITINAYIHTNESDFIEEFIQQIAKLNPQKMINQKTVLQDSVNFFALEQYLQEWNGNCIIQIDQIDELANSKRQVLLYNFLEWLQGTQKNIVLVGISSNLKFQENLEKRVRSRMSSENKYQTIMISNCLQSKIYTDHRSQLSGLYNYFKQLCVAYRVTKIQIALQDMGKINLSAILIEEALHSLIRLKLIKIEESKQEAVENQQIILNMSLNELNDYINETKGNWPQYLYQLASQ